ncbi:MAG: divergent PAP2 family protein [Clostridiaceae bacterium]|nr:divergent PAP2 family protein [Clostridiaceae bacterium]
MDILSGILSNKTITVPAIAWFTASFIKVINVILVERKVDFTRFVGTGGMPSSHSAFIVSLAAVIAKIKGIDSSEFGITFAISLIVMYDAAGIRRAAGKQAKVLNKLIFSHNDNVNFDEKLKELLGHSPFEVIMGALLGIIVGIWLG